MIYESPVELARIRDDSCCRVEDTLQLVGRLLLLLLLLLLHFSVTRTSVNYLPEITAHYGLVRLLIKGHKVIVTQSR